MIKITFFNDGELLTVKTIKDLANSNEFILPRMGEFVWFDKSYYHVVAVEHKLNMARNVNTKTQLPWTSRSLEQEIHVRLTEMMV